MARDKKRKRKKTRQNNSIQAGQKVKGWQRDKETQTLPTWHKECQNTDFTWLFSRPTCSFEERDYLWRTFIFLYLLICLLIYSLSFLSLSSISSFIPLLLCQHPPYFSNPNILKFFHITSSFISFFLYLSIFSFIFQSFKSSCLPSFLPPSLLPSSLLPWNSGQTSLIIFSG